LNNVAEQVQLLMRRNGISSVNELSRRSGITLSALQALVSGKSNPRPSTLRALGQFFGVNPKDLMSDLGGATAKPVSLRSTAEVLRYLMDDVCVSERELARLTGIAQKTINNILHGRTSTPTDASLNPVAEFFSVTLEQLRAEHPLDRQRRKGETNEHLLQKYQVPLIPWERLSLLPESSADESNERVHTTFSEPTLYATRLGDYFAMAPIMRSHDLLIVDYDTQFSAGEIFIVQTMDDVVVGNYVKKQHKEVIHFSNPKFEPLLLLKGRYRKLGRVREIRRGD
jgi:transcriptional regulator with XRE-family HTH domain